MKLKKVLSLILCVAMVLGTVGTSVLADEAEIDVWDGTADTSWYSEGNTEFKISTAEELAGLAKLVNEGVAFHDGSFTSKTITLTTNIDLDGKMWTPIGNAGGERGKDNGFYPFMGTFDGNYKTISNVMVYDTNEPNLKYANIGLFGSIGKYGDAPITTVKNLTVNNAKVITSQISSQLGSNVAAIIGNANASTVITNVHLKGTVEIEGWSFIGGIVGHGYPQMSDCSVEADGTIHAYQWCCGALVGYLGEGADVYNCTVKGFNEGLKLSSVMAGIGGAVGRTNGGSTVDNIVVENVDISTSEYYANNYGAGYVTSGADTPTNSVVVDVVVKADGEGYTPDDAQNVTIPVAQIGDVYYSDLNEALAKAGEKGAGNTTVDIIADVNLENDSWTPVWVDGYNGADIVTVNGNGHTITNLPAPLFKGGFAGGSGIIINDLTIADSEIVSTHSTGSGAFIEYIDAMDVITLNNCHLLNSSITGSRTGGLIGYTAGYNNQNDGPVKTNVTIKGCSVIDCTITGSAVGAINGHAGSNAWTYTTIEDCTIKDNDLISTDDGDWRVGVVVGTANIGEVTINNITESGNTLTQANAATPAFEGQTSLIGRSVPGTTGNLVIDDIAYTSECKPYAVTVKDDNGAVGYNSLEEAVANIGAGEVVIQLSQDASLDVSDAYIALGTDDTESITINGNNNRLDLTTTYWSRLNLKNPDAKLILNDMTVDSSQESGTWNSYDVTFMCPVELNNVVFEKAVALENDAALKNVKITETHDYYALWISANGQEVSIDGLTITSDGRGIKIDDEYVSNAGKVKFDIKNATFKTAKKAAIIVDSSAGAAITAEKCDISQVAADSENLVWIDEGRAADQKEVTVNGKPAFVENQCVVLGEDMFFASIEDAVANAQPGDTIKLLANITEKVVIEAPAVATLALNDNAIVIDLNGKTLNGYIHIKDAAKNIEIKNGNIVNEDSKESAIESEGTLTVTNVDIVSARGAINIEGGKAEINGGNYSLIQKEVLTQNVIGAENAEVTINSGVFTGPAGTTADSGAAVAAKTGSNVTINGGYFSGGKLYTLSENATATLVVNGGSFDQDVSAYVADGKEVVKLGEDKGYEYPYIVTGKATSTVAVDLVKVSDSLYDIVLTSDGTYDIHEFVAAQFTFKNDSKTVGGSEMKYNVLGIEEKTTAQKTVVDGEERYIIKIVNAEDPKNRLSGDTFKIGQISFVGQGTINFSIAKGEVDTTWQNTNLGRYYENADAIDDATDTLKLADAKIENGSVADITKNLSINVAYNHDLKALWDNNEITVTVKDAYGELVGTDDISDGIASFNNVKIGRITVTLEAPGFRKFVYETTLDEDDDATVVLYFWNDVKKDAYKLPIEKDATPVAHNFVVGDIVMDYTVDKYDLAAVTSYYGMYNIKNNAKYLKYDLNRDGNIDIRDVQYVLHTMGN